MNLVDLDVIAAYLNTSCRLPSGSRYEFEVEANLKDAQAVAQTIHDGIFPPPSIGFSVDTSNEVCPNIIVSEEGANKYRLLIEPLPLGQVALTAWRPNHRPPCSLTTRSSLANPSDWVNSLSLVPSAFALRTLVAGSELREMQETFGVVDCDVAENICKTCGHHENILTGFNRQADLLQGIFLECILSTPPGGTAKLRVGVLDDPTIVVGVSMDEIYKWRVAVKGFTRNLFPAIPLNNVGISLWRVKIDLQGECVCFAVGRKKDIPRLLKLFRGKIKFDAACSKCMVAKGDLDSILNDNDPAVDGDRRKDVKWIASKPQLPVRGIDSMERYLLVISVKVPGEYAVMGQLNDRITSMFDDSSVPIKWSSQQKSFPAMRSGDIFSAWLRAKGLVNGAIRANMLTSLLGSPIRILLCQEDEIPCVQRSLCIYTGEQVNIDLTVTESPPTTWMMERLRELPRGHPVVFICTWKSAALLNTTLRLMPVRMVRDCLLLANVEDGLFIKGIKQRFLSFDVRITVRDVALMESSGLVDAISGVGSSTGSPNPLCYVPMGNMEIADEILRRELFDRWMRASTPPPWELVQADVVFISESVRKGLIAADNARKTQGSSNTHIIIEKTAPGCGASCALRRMGHELQRHYGARCFFLNDRMGCRKEMVSDYVCLALERLQNDPISCHWIVVLIDEHELANDFVEAVLAVRVPGKHITVISVQGGLVRSKPAVVSIDPFLTIDDTRSLATVMSTYLPDSRESMDHLVMHLENQDSPRCPERHIYVLMLTAYKSEFLPMSTYLDQRMESIPPGFERSLVYLLVLLSRYSLKGSARWASMPYSKIDSLSPSAHDLLCDRGEKVSFLHPLLADALLRLHLPEGESFCNRLASLSGHLNILGKICGVAEKQQICMTLLCERKQNALFSELVQTLFDERAIHVLNLFLDIPAINRHLRNFFQQILLSRWMRCDNNLEAALAYAEEALRIAESELTTHSNMARSNLGEFGEAFARMAMKEAAAKRARFQEYFPQVVEEMKEMEKLFEGMSLSEEQTVRYQKRLEELRATIGTIMANAAAAFHDESEEGRPRRF